MRIPIDRQSDVPLYQQIENFLRQAILSGSLAPETRLPATRQLAKDLGVNRITVETAYAALDADGLILTRTGSGTYILPPVELPTLEQTKNGATWPLWQQDLQKQNAPKQSPEAMLAESGVADPINFGGGRGDARLFPVEDYRKVIQEVIRRDGMAALDYGDNSGYLPLRQTIAHILASQGIPAQPEHVLVTAGSQQAIALVAQLLLKPGDTVVVEQPTYAVALDLFHALGLNVIGIPMDAYGMQVEVLEDVLKTHQPKLLYTIPNFHNPTGICLSGFRRRQLIALADRCNLPILEDDYVGDLRYDGHATPALKSLDPGGRVIYASTFSKMLMPGLRVGFLVAEGPVYSSLVEHKHINDLTTSNLHQRSLEAYMSVGRYQAHLKRTVLLYRKRRDAMIEAINRYLPATVTVSTPQGGLFLWLQLPPGLSAEKLLPIACQEGVAFAPGYRFNEDRAAGDRFIRLNFAGQPEEMIQEGIKRLGSAMRRVERMLSDTHAARGMGY